MNNEMRFFMALLAIFGGILHGFFGYRMFKVALAITGLFVGAAIAGHVAVALGAADIIVTVAALCGGIVGMLLLAPLYLSGVFVVGAVFGTVLAAAVLEMFDSGWHSVVALVPGIVLGLVALCFQKIMIMVATAFCGAAGIVLGLAALVVDDLDLSRPVDFLAGGTPVAWGCVLLIAITGIMGLSFQLRR